MFLNAMVTIKFASINHALHTVSVKYGTEQNLRRVNSERVFTT